MPLTHLLKDYRRTLLSTTMGCLLITSLPSEGFAAFNPDAGKDDVKPIAKVNTARQRTAPEPMMMITRSAAPLYPQGKAEYVQPVSDVEMPTPLYPMRTAVPVQAIEAAPAAEPMQVAAANIAPLPDAAPQAEIAQTETATGEFEVAGYIAPPPPLPNMVPMSTAVSTPAAPAPVTAAAATTAPAPVMASTVANEAAPVDIVAPVDARLSTGKAMNSQLSVSAPPPVMASSAPAPIQHTELSRETREILGRIPARLGEKAPETRSRSTIDRVSPDVAQLIPNLKASEYEAAGLKISVTREHFDANEELTRAYEALIAGDSEMAVDIYQDILAAEPRNEEALFGLAATYHRAGETEKARPLYGALLRQNPEHREALNNFLVLVSEEAPNEALFELQKLAERNPDFSPIRAQMALVLEKLGQHELAYDQMLKAIRLSPENLVYKYNLAIMMDRQGRYADAAALYNLLVEAALRGESIPARLDDIQKRMNYIQTASLDMTRGS